MDLPTMIVDLLRKGKENRAVQAGTLPPRPTSGMLLDGTNHQAAGQQIEGRRAMIERALAEMGE
jgi:hypothetical protein